MALRQDIEIKRDRALTHLRHAHDYHYHTQSAWRTLQQEVQRNGLTFDWRNRATNSIVKESDMLGFVQRYVAVELASSTLQQFVAIFESFLHEVFRSWLLAYPQRLSKLQLTGSDICSLPDKNAILNALVEKRLRDVFYDRPANWFEELRTLANIPSPSAEDAEQFAEIKATRDALVHGQGMASSIYVDKAGKAARVAAGQPLDIPEPYHQQSWELIYKLVQHIGSEMAAKAS
ncbi:MAG: hypothetical protein ACYC26_14605 [Phycisphaerales bacterium]